MNRGLSALSALLLGALLVLTPQSVLAHEAVPHSSAAKEQVGFDQRLNKQVPLELVFRDEQGQSVTLDDYLGDKPVILALAYFDCDALCPLVRTGLVESLKPLAFSAGDEFEVVMVSIDPGETADIAMTVKQETVAAYGRSGSAAGWHFLTGEHEAIDALAERVGFRFAYDGELDEYAHASGVILLTPQGRVARYFFGIEYASQDLRLGLIEASQNRIGSVIDQLLLLCYHYDPSTGKYSLMIMNILRGAGVLTVGLIGGLIFVLRRKESHSALQDRAGSPASFV
jgi:protein SCO1/2